MRQRLDLKARSSVLDPHPLFCESSWYFFQKISWVSVSQNRPYPSLTQNPSGSMVKSLLPVQEMKVRFLGQEETWRRKLQHPPVFLLGKSMDRGAWWATVHGGHKRVRHDLVTKQQQKCPWFLWIGQRRKSHLHDFSTWHHPQVKKKGCK